MPKIKHARTLSLLFALLFCFSKPVPAQTLETRVDSLIRKNISDTSGPGAVFLIAQHGQPVYQKALGKANLELGVNLQPDYIFELGSMTKQFTAIAILILEEQGKLAVTDPVFKYIPDYPNGKNITIHHLLTHTSGIKDFTKMNALSGIAQKEMSPKMMVDFFKNEPVDFAPGEKFDYNNSGYVLLGYIIEVASGYTYENFIRKNIFEKVGMTESGYASDRKIIKKRAYGYQKKSSGYVNKSSISFSVPFSSGALMSTLTDMLKWQNALNRHLLLSAKETDKAFTNYRLNNGQNIGYGYGWHITELNGLKSREHGGSIFGFKTMGVYIPKEDLYVLALSNCDCNSPTQLARDIASLALNNIRHR